MKPRLVLAPIALLSASCAMRPFTPSVSVVYWAQDVPGTAPTQVPTGAEAIARWQLPEGNPWAPFSKMTLLTALEGSPATVDLPDVQRLDVVRNAQHAAETLARAGIPADALVVLDLRGAASVAFAATLSRQSARPVSPVLTFHNWPAEEEMVPAEETLAALVTQAPRTPASAAPGTPVFMLDAWRLAFRDELPDDDVYDNRYALAQSDLPDAGQLLGQGIRRVIYVVEDLDDTETEEDDVHDAALSWQAAGITMHMVDLRWIERRASSDAWPAPLDERRLHVRPRVTILASGRLSARARGGFGFGATVIVTGPGGGYHHSRGAG